VAVIVSLFSTMGEIRLAGPLARPASPASSVCSGADTSQGDRSFTSWPGPAQPDKTTTAVAHAPITAARHPLVITILLLRWLALPHLAGLSLWGGIDMRAPILNGVAPGTTGDLAQDNPGKPLCGIQGISLTLNCL
jgi:hypothetical protein